MGKNSRDRRVLILFCCLIVLSAFWMITFYQPAPRSSLRSTDKVRNIDMIVKMNQGYYWNTVKMGAEVAAKEYNVNLRFVGPEREDDIEGQIQLVDQSILDQVDAIILAASDYMGLAQVTDRAAHHRIPIIAVDTKVASARVKTTISANNYEAGQRAAERLVELIEEQGKVGIVSFVEGTRNADERAEGLLDYLARYSDIKVLDVVYCGSNQELAAELTRKMLRENPDLKGVIALNEVASLGAAKAVIELNAADQVKLITFDSPPEVIEKLQEGIVQATVIQNPFSNGYLAVQYAVEATEGLSLPERVDSGSKLIDLDNMLWPENQKQLFPFVK